MFRAVDPEGEIVNVVEMWRVKSIAFDLFMDAYEGLYLAGSGFGAEQYEGQIEAITKFLKCFDITKETIKEIQQEARITLMFHLTGKVPERKGITGRVDWLKDNLKNLA